MGSSLIILIVIICGSIISKNKEKDLDVDNKQVDVSDVDNVSIVDEKLKQGDYRVSQSYLLNYTKRKGNVWYSSKGIVTNIKYKNNTFLMKMMNFY